MEDTQPIATLPTEHKDEWNKFVTHLDGDYPNEKSLASYKEANPKTPLTPEHIPAAINDVAKIKANPDVQGLTPAYKNGNSFMYPVTEKGQHIAFGGDPSSIPKPDYNNPQSRLKYAEAFTKKYGPLMQGRGDTPLRVNEAPDGWSAPVKEVATKVASKYGLDPALLYSSAMEEGMSGLFPDKHGDIDYSGDKKFPVQGFHNFGLDDFSDKADSLIKKGYLPPEFKSQYSPKVETNENGRKVNSANFATADAALQAKAAVVKDTQDHLEDFAKKSNITLSPKAKEFFSLIGYNAGEGNMRKMLSEYSKNGYLEGDKFLEKQPSKSWSEPYLNTIRRLKMRDALKAEGLF